MTITITEPGEYICNSEDQPETGCKYSLESAVNGTGAQNRAFHALVMEYYRSRCWSYSGSGYDGGATFAEFRNMIKRKLGAGFESYVYAEIIDGKARIREAKRYEDIPEAIRLDPDLRELVRGRLKSWADYSKRERMRTIDALIAEMHETGVKTQHFYDILEGMQDLGE